MTLFWKTLALVFVLLVIGGICLWIVGARQPSQVISRHGTILFLALKHGSSPRDRIIDPVAEPALWRGRVEFPFIGVNEAYWTEYVLLPPDSGVLAELKESTLYEDIFAAEVELVQIPAFALGMLRVSHKLGLLKRPEGPLPESLDETAGRPDVLPTIDALNAARAAPQTMQVTMMNYLEYRPMQDGGKDRGRRTYNKYGREAMKAVHMVGGQFLFAGQISKVLIEPKHSWTPGQWDDLAAMIYPDPMAIFYMEQSADYKSALNFRDKSLERSVVIAVEAY